MRRIVIAAFVASAATCAAIAQEGAPPTAPLDEQRHGADLTADRSLRMTVPVLLDGHGPFPFVVDTGAERTVVSTELAEQLALRPAGSVRVHSVTQSTAVPIVRVDRLEIETHHAVGLDAPALPERHLGGVGMIGIDSLRQQRVILDFARKRMTIEPSARRERVPARGDDIVVTARANRGRLVVMDASVEGVDVAVVLDTGSQVSIGNPRLGELLSRRSPQRLIVDAIIHDVTGGSISARFTPTREVRIGGVTMTNLTVAIADAPVFAELDIDRRPAMLLGMDALRAFDRVSIDFPRRRARFLLPEEATTAPHSRIAALP